MPLNGMFDARRAISAARIVHENSLAVAIRHDTPLTPLHTLVVPRRHAQTWFDLSVPEQRAVGILLGDLRRSITDADGSVVGFNITTDCGVIAGQQVPHATVEVIPRRDGDGVGQIGRAHV